MGSDVDGVVLGEEFKGYTFRITGGNDKQGFAMKQGILVNGRVRILMKKSKFNYYPHQINTVCLENLLLGSLVDTLPSIRLVSRVVIDNFYGTLIYE